MKLRRVMRGRGGSEGRFEGERKGKAAEKRLRLARRKRGGTLAAGHLLVPVRSANAGDAVAWTHAVERRESDGVRRLIEVDGSKRTREGIVPHIRLKGPHRRENAATASRPPLEAIQPEGGHLV